MPTATPTASPLLGDVNEDGRVNVEDIQLVAGHWGASASNPDHYDPRCDFDGDGNIDVVDIAVVAGQLGEVQ